MENASKALLIAGSILIGMLVISVFYFSFGQLGGVVEQARRGYTAKGTCGI